MSTYVSDENKGCGDKDAWHHEPSSKYVPRLGGMNQEHRSDYTRISRELNPSFLSLSTRANAPDTGESGDAYDVEMIAIEVVAAVLQEHSEIYLL